MPTVILPAHSDRAAAEALLPELLAAVDAGSLEIDGRQVTQVSQAMLQLLVSARNSGHGVAIRPGPALIDAAQLAGLSAELFDEARL